MPRHRLITIAGPGGIGKTSVALAVAERSLAAYEDGVWLVDLAPLSDAGAVASAVSSALGLQGSSDNPLPRLIASLSKKNLLLLLDNCEQVIEATASLAIGILKGAPGVQILATSREPLRVEGERVWRLSPLPSPAASAKLTAAEALAFPAVQLFVERAAASMDEFELTDADTPLVVDICGKLDGLPLAIELAAARIEAFGVHGLTAHLDERIRLPSSGRRTAAPRHRTLTATIDWSYQLLSEAEQTVLRQVAIFAGGFTLSAASAVIAHVAQPLSDLTEPLAGLIAKSLVSVDLSEAEPRYRLLDTTRAYALEKLAESGELNAIGRRHAEYYRDLLAAAARDETAADDWPAACAREIDNIRAALTWATAIEAVDVPATG